jgi:hypothetical protein
VHQKASIGSGIHFAELTTLGKLNILVNITFFSPQLFKIDRTDGSNVINNTTRNRTENAKFNIVIPLREISSPNSLNA